MPHQRSRKTAAFTLLELLIVIVVIGVLAGMILPNSNPSAAAQLQSAAGILGHELEYARNLAVSNSDTYKISFDATNNRWTLTYSGSNSDLSILPYSAVHRLTDSPTQQIVSLSDLPSMGGGARIYSVWAAASSAAAVTDIEFSSLGGTTRAASTVIWLVAGAGSNTRYLAVRVNPITGLYWVENFQSTAPTGASTLTQVQAATQLTTQTQSTGQ